jgi:hypothetical protein
VEFPLAHVLGVNMQTVTPLEKELARLQVGNESIYAREKRQPDTRAITWGQGRVVEQHAGRVIGSPAFRALPPPGQRIVLKRFLQGARQAALAQLPPERQRAIRQRRQDPDVQELRRYYR